MLDTRIWVFGSSYQMHILSDSCVLHPVPMTWSHRARYETQQMYGF